MLASSIKSLFALKDISLTKVYYKERLEQFTCFIFMYTNTTRVSCLIVALKILMYLSKNTPQKSVYIQNAEYNLSVVSLTEYHTSTEHIHRH